MSGNIFFGTNSSGFYEEKRHPIHPLVEENKYNTVPQHFLSLLSQIDKNERNCPICCELITEDMVLTPCYHMFHKSCLVQCHTNNCPICRLNL